MLCCLNRTVMVLALNDNHHAAVPIPAGTVVDVTPSAGDERFVIVSVDGQNFLAFASDVAVKPNRTATMDTGEEENVTSGNPQTEIAQKLHPRRGRRPPSTAS